MAEFIDPFKGMVPDRMLTKEEIIRALRLDLAAEEEAVHLYNAQADAINDIQVATILRDIAKEEVVHIGEFQKLILNLTGNEEADLLNKGAEEVDQKVGSGVESPVAITITTESKGKKMSILDEAKDLNVYKKLLQVLGEYSDKFPGTGVGRMFDQAVKNGKKILPKDPLAIDILHFILKTSSTPEAVNKILNWRFCCLPIELRPLVKNGRRKEVASWTRDALISNKIRDLIDWEGAGKSGHWTNVEGEKVQLHDLSKKEK